MFFQLVLFLVSSPLDLRFGLPISTVLVLSPRRHTPNEHRVSALCGTRALPHLYEAPPKSQALGTLLFPKLETLTTALPWAQMRLNIFCHLSKYYTNESLQPDVFSIWEWRLSSCEIRWQTSIRQCLPTNSVLNHKLTVFCPMLN